MSMDLPEFQACVTAYRNWFQEILNSMDAVSYTHLTLPTN